MRPLVLSVLLFAHALAHAAAGALVAARSGSWLVTPLWIVSMCGFMAAAFAVGGLERLQPRAEHLTYAATAASVVLLRLGGFGTLPVVGLCAGLLCSIAVRRWARCARPEIHTPTIATSPGIERSVERPSVVRRLGAAAAYLFLAYTALLIALRPHAAAAAGHDEDTPASIPSIETLVRASLDLYLSPRAREPGHP